MEVSIYTKCSKVGPQGPLCENTTRAEPNRLLIACIQCFVPAREGDRHPLAARIATHGCTPLIAEVVLRKPAAPDSPAPRDPVIHGLSNLKLRTGQTICRIPRPTPPAASGPSKYMLFRAYLADSELEGPETWAEAFDRTARVVAQMRSDLADADRQATRKLAERLAMEIAESHPEELTDEKLKELVAQRLAADKLLRRGSPKARDEERPVTVSEEEAVWLVMKAMGIRTTEEVFRNIGDLRRSEDAKRARRVEELTEQLTEEYLAQMDAEDRAAQGASVDAAAGEPAGRMSEEGKSDEGDGSAEDNSAEDESDEDELAAD